ncbi:MAG: CARDB domain-containing protein [Thermoplasmatota archaeon]
MTKKVLSIIAMFVALSFLLNLWVMENSQSDAAAWYDGEPLSPAYPNYGIQDIIADEAYKLLLKHHPEEADYITYWYLPDGADDWEDSFVEGNMFPNEHDNFLAYIDGAPVGDMENYFVHNSKGWETTDAAQEVQKYVNYTIQNLTTWMLQGRENGSKYQHRAVRWLAWMSHLVGDMSQFGHTDYSRWDQAAHPNYDPDDGTYQLYYERFIWTDEAMDALIEDFENLTFHIPDLPDADKIHAATGNIAKWVNTRGEPPVTIEDYPEDSGLYITVGPTYKEMLETFRYNWDYQKTYKGVYGMNATLWNLTLENIRSSTENLTAMYRSIYQQSYDRFIELSPELTVVDWSISPADPIENDLVTVTATIKNQGENPTRQAFQTSLYANVEDGFQSLRSLTLEADSEKNVTFAPFKVGTDPVIVTLRADYSEIIPEADEENNVFNFTFTPIPEHHEVALSLDSPFNELRRDTVKPIFVAIKNLGNRFDLFNLSGLTTTENLMITPPTEPIGVEAGGVTVGQLMISTSVSTPLGAAGIDIKAEGLNSSFTLPITVTLIDRTNDPVPPNPVEYAWARVEEQITLTAAGWTDPDGDSLYFTWRVPEWGNFTTNDVTFNYTKPGIYNIILEGYDGNVTVSVLWKVEIFPAIPVNLSVSTKPQMAGVELTWKRWPSGGLISYWLTAEAVPGQGDRSNRGPYLSRYGPGNTTGRVGSFYPGTEVEVTFYVEAERFGNKSMFTGRAVVNGTGEFDSQFQMEIDNFYLTVYYKPWEEPEGTRIPTIFTEKWFDDAYVPIDSEMEIISQTPRRDSVRYQLKSNSGKFRTTLTYYFLNETVVPFSFIQEIEITNKYPELSLVGFKRSWELDNYESEGGEVRVRLSLAIDDPDDTISLEVDWGDGSQIEYYERQHTTGDELNHTYSAVGLYDIVITGTDWSGSTGRVNVTVEVIDYVKDDPIWSIEELSVWQIVLMIIVFILILIIIIGLSYVGYRFAKKETTVEFDMDELKKRKLEKPGTGTDFDQRRQMQIPKESIMGGGRRQKEPEAEKKEDYPEPKVDEGAPGAPMISGTITFDDDEE